MSIFGGFSDGSDDHVESTERTRPEFSGFDEYSDFSNQEIDTYIEETIPDWHLDGCDRITCDPEDPAWEEGALGYHIEYGDGSPSEICVAGRDVMEDAGYSEQEVLCHEIGHNAHNNLSPAAKMEWMEIHANSWETDGFVSDYAHYDVYEDFAESYNAYINNPELLKFVSEEKYEFMRDHVFDGREY